MQIFDYNSLAFNIDFKFESRIILHYDCSLNFSNIKFDEWILIY